MPRRTNSELAASIGTRVRAARVAAKLSQEEVAARAGLQPETISRLENGRLSPTLTSVAALAKALGVEPGDLAGFGSTGSPPPVSPEEQEILDRWRRLPARRRRLVEELLRELGTRE